jgi:hypothetical protein
VSEPQYLEFEVYTHSQTVRVPYWPGSEAERLHAQWRATDHDDDFTELVEWMRDDIAERIDFDVEDIR